MILTCVGMQQDNGGWLSLQKGKDRKTCLGGGAFPQLVETSLSGRLSPRNSGGTACRDSPGFSGVWQCLDLASGANAQGRKNADTASRLLFPCQGRTRLGKEHPQLQQTLRGRLGPVPLSCVGVVA